MHVKIRKRIGNPTLYNAKINYSHRQFLNHSDRLRKHDAHLYCQCKQVYGKCLLYAYCNNDTAWDFCFCLSLSWRLAMPYFDE